MIKETAAENARTRPLSPCLYPLSLRITSLTAFVSTSYPIPYPSRVRRTVSDVSMTVLGLMVAFVQVILAAGMQVDVFILQQRYNMRPETFIAQTAWIQGAVLLTLGPIIDRILQGSWIFEEFFRDDPSLPGTLFYVILSATVAIAVNVSQAMSIGAASALGAAASPSPV